MNDKKDSLLVKKVLINGQTYNFELTNPEKNGGEVCLEFSYKNKSGDPENYKIFINKEGLRFSRGFYESEDEVCGGGGMADCKLLKQKVETEKRKFSWSEYSPHEDEDYVVIPFIE